MFLKRACPRNGGRPFLLPVGDEEEEGKGGDDEVDAEDHQQPAHDIPEVKFRYSEHGNGPEWLNHVGHHIGPGKRDDRRAHADPQLFSRRDDIRRHHCPLSTAGGNEIVEKPSIPVDEKRKGLWIRDGHKSLCEYRGEEGEFKKPENSSIERELDHDSPNRLPCILGRFQE